ncbi:MAG: NAD(P)/FAD-dependent oxidoreductase, partial [Calditrichaeota bacterium]|nr:NAD(P)/FAD-dependent oxidoreductase [Calditrichota bacterium]
VIVGNGIAGTTVARHVRKRSAMRIIMISAESNYFYSRTALMYIYMGHMRFDHTKPYEDWFWEKNKIELIHDYVEEIDLLQKSVNLKGGQKIAYDHLVLATGSKPNKFGWPGQDLPGVQGFYSLQDLELMEENTRNCKNAVIVGGGLIGIEVAEMLKSRQIHVTFLIRENEYWDNVLPANEAALISNHILSHDIDLRKQSQLKEIIAGNDGRVCAVITDAGERIDCQFVALTAGVSPNIDLAKKSGILVQRGILVNEQLKTSIDTIYACGDCAEIVSDSDQRIEQLWYTGKLQGESLAQTILGNDKNYNRGIWFNSAKFFDIEYQTYGVVANTVQADEESFYWQDSTRQRCLRIVFKLDNEVISGVNVFGIRMRQKVWEKWISKQKTIDYVMTHLRDANFDPEFFRQYETEIIEEYNKQFSKTLKLKQKSWTFRRAL